MSEPIIFNRHKDYAEIILNRPDALNALDGAMLVALQAAIQQLQQCQKTRCVWLKAAGKHFMAGGDVKLFATLTMSGEQRSATLAPMMHELHECMMALTQLPMPVVTSIQGAVAGFGLGLMMASDMIFASEKAYFNLAYIRLGLCPDGLVTYWLPRKIGMTRATEMAFLGETITAEIACQYQLINAVVPAALLEGQTKTYIDRLCRQSQTALIETKKLLRSSLDSTMMQQSKREISAFSRCVQGRDFLEGVSAFIEKRTPDFYSDS